MIVLTSKQPSEEYAISFDFTDVLGTETIDTITVTAADHATGASATATLLDAGAQANTDLIVYPWVQAGTSGHNYIITCIVVGSAGSVYELDAILPVQEIPASPADEPVTLTEAKLHLRLAVDETSAVAYTSEDDYLTALIQTAREQAEGVTWRSLITQSRTLYLQDWPSKDFIEIPYPPLQAVTGVYYTVYGDTTETTLSIDYYSVDTTSTVGRIVLKLNCIWPTDQLITSNPIRIAYTAGYGIPSQVPASIKAAMLLIISDLYDNRGEVVVGALTSRITRAIDSLLDKYKVRMYQ